MRPSDFKLERYFARHEFNAPYLLCCSDCESLTVRDLLDMQAGSQDEFHDLWLDYTESQGDQVLREEIASLYRTIAPQQILVHSGAEEAIHNMAAALLQPGDHVIVQMPCYQSLSELPTSIGCQVSGWYLRPQSGGWQADLYELQALITPRTRLIIVNSPHNPTGHLFSREKWVQILDLAAQHGIILFADEVYKYMEHTDEPLPWACDVYENAVSLGVMSKSFGLPGLRIGWIATNNTGILKAMAAYKDYTTICNSAPSEFLATLALRNRSGILERNRRLVKENLQRLEQFFARHRDRFEWLRPGGGPIAFPAFRDAVSASAYAERMAAQSGILILPGSCYDYDDRHFRIGFGRANFPEALQKWEEYLGQSD
ncbi:MAG: aminotransferase class I/II-fold pyridoxal phosphate-dependent enzyme [Syntrophomonadaceae bacterium]